MGSSLAESVRAEALGVRQVHPHAVGEGNFVEAVNPQDFLGNVRLAGHVPAVSGYFEGPVVLGALRYANVQRGQNGFLNGVGNGMSHQLPGFFWRKDDGFGLQHGVVGSNGRGPAHNFYLWAGFAQDCDQSGQSVRTQGGVNAAFVTKRGVGVEAVAFGCFAHRAGVKPGGLYHHLGGSGLHPRMQTAENPGQTEGFTLVANHEVVGVQGAFFLVQGGQLFAGTGFAYNKGAVYGGGVKGMQGVSRFVQHPVGGIHHVVDGFKTNSGHPGLKGLGRRLNGNAPEGQGQVLRAGIQILYPYRGTRVRGGGGQLRCRGKLGLGRCAAVREYGRQIPGYAKVPQGVGAVGRQAHFQGKVGLPSQVVGQGLAHLSAGIQHPDSVVRGSQAQFVFGAQHAFGHFASNLAFLDFKRFGGAGRVQGGAHGGYRHFLAHCHIGGAAHNGKGLIRPNGNGGQPEPVCVGVLHNGQHFAHDYTPQPAGDAFYFFDGLNLQSGRRQHFCHFGRGRKGGQVREQFLQPGV